MRIAVASDDGMRVALHTGRCRGFVVFDVTGQDAAFVEHRANAFTDHARGACDGEHAHEQGGVHSHGPLVAALSDCRVLITRGVGPRLVADLAAGGIDAYVCTAGGVDEAAELYAQGRLPKAVGRSCDRHVH